MEKYQKQTPKERNYCNKNLNSTINKRRRELKTLTEEYSSILKNLKDSTTWMKGTLVIYSIKQQQNKLYKKTKERHQKKLYNLVINKRINDGIRKNPNQTITNLSDIELNDDEIAVLKFGLKHGLLIRPKENEMIAVMEDIYDQTVRQDLLKKGSVSKHCVQTALKSFTYSYLDLGLRNFRVDQRTIKVLCSLKEGCMELKPDKGQGIVVVNKKGYYDSLDQLFIDPTKFEILNEDPTLRDLSAIQRYLNTLELRGEITTEENKQMTPKFSQIGRTQGLPNIHKQFFKVPSFRLIVDTTNTLYYGVGKFLINLLNPLTQNDYTVKGSFEAVNMVHKIPPELFHGDYRHFSFDVNIIIYKCPFE